MPASSGDIGVIVPVGNGIDGIYGKLGYWRTIGYLGKVDWNPACAVYISIGGGWRAVI